MDMVEKKIKSRIKVMIGDSDDDLREVAVNNFIISSCLSWL